MCSATVARAARRKPCRSFWARTGFPAEPNSAAKQLKARLSAAFERFLEDVPRNRQVSFDDDGWRLKTDRAEQLEPEQSALLVELRHEPVMSDEDRVRLARFAPAGRSAEGVLGMAVFGRVGLFSAHVPARACEVSIFTRRHSTQPRD